MSHGPSIPPSTTITTPYSVQISLTVWSSHGGNELSEGGTTVVRYASDGISTHYSVQRVISGCHCHCRSVPRTLYSVFPLFLSRLGSGTYCTVKNTLRGIISMTTVVFGLVPITVPIRTDTRPLQSIHSIQGKYSRAIHDGAN